MAVRATNVALSGSAVPAASHGAANATTAVLAAADDEVFGRGCGAVLRA
ncbi:PE domain-containing protein [Mycobacterium kubicae]|nr:PE domain-containing protein [Mycobacterium kubicae]